MPLPTHTWFANHWTLTYSAVTCSPRVWWRKEGEREGETAVRKEMTNKPQILFCLMHISFSYTGSKYLFHCYFDSCHHGGTESLKSALLLFLDSPNLHLFWISHYCKMKHSWLLYSFLQHRYWQKNCFLCFSVWLHHNPDFLIAGCNF